MKPADPALITRDWLPRVERLLAAPYPAAFRTASGDSAGGGPDHHLATLRAGQDFWESRDEELVEAAEQVLAADAAALAAALSTAWGPAEVLDLEPFLGLDGEDGATESAEPLARLCALAGELLLWRRPGGRFVGLTVGQEEPELPLCLLVAVGECGALER